MQRIAFLAIGTFAATAAVASATALAQAPTQMTGAVDLTPRTTGTAVAPRGAALKLESHWRTPDGIEQPAVSRMEVLLPRGLRYSGDLHPSCTQETLTAKGLAGCPRRSIVGKGTATTQADVTISRSPIKVVNGGGKRLYLFTELTNPSYVQAPIVGVIKKRSGKWSYELTLAFPRALQVVGGVPVALLDLTLTAGDKTGQRDWLATVGCPTTRRWRTGVRAYYDTGGSSGFTDSAACRPLRVQSGR